MNQQESEALAQFCADQYDAFDARAWHRRSQHDRNASNVAAMYLSMTSWYGYGGSLRKIAEELHPGIASGGVFSEEMQAMDFDLTRFSSTTRYLILEDRAGNG